MSLYLPSGYLNAAALFNDPSPFVFMIGARGIGKTYGALKYVKDNSLRFVYLRMTDIEVKNLSGASFNVFKSINEDTGSEIQTRREKNVVRFVDESTPDKKTVGYMFALSTLSNFRSFDLSDVDVIIFDEFIPEANKRPLRNMAETLFNAYESINRNRELKGKPPIKLLGLANSNNIFNDIFFYLRVTKRVYDMRKKGRERYEDRERGLTIFYSQGAPVSEAKKETALYKLTQGTGFQSVAIDNDFSFEDSRLISPKNLNGFKPVVNIGELYIYSNSDNLYYITTYRQGVFKYTYEMVTTDITSYLRTFYHVWAAYIDNRLSFEDVYCVEVFNLIYSL